MNGDNHQSSPSYRDWKPGRYAVRFERWDPGNARGVRIALHGADPFVAEVAGAAPPVENDYTAIGHSYLKALNDFLGENGGDGLGLPAGWLDALDPELLPKPLRWLPLWPAPDDDGDGIRTPEFPLASWNLERKTSPDPEADPDRTVVLVAAETVPRPDGQRPFSLDFGLRVPMVLRPRPGGGWEVHVRSMTAELPFAPYRSFTEVLAARKLAPAGPDGLLETFAVDRLAEATEAYGADIADRLQMDRELVYEDFRVRWHDEEAPTIAAVEMLGRGTGALRKKPRPVPYAFTVDLVPTADGQTFEPGEPGGARKHLLAANAGPAGVFPDVFPQDPPSWRDMTDLDSDPGAYDWAMRRPTRGDSDLDRYRVPPPGGPEQGMPLDHRHFKVRNCPGYVHGDPDNDAPKHVMVPGGVLLPVRDNDVSALCAFANCSRFYDLVAGFGIDLDTFVVAARPEMQVHYRSGITPGPGRDGQTVNAQVTIEPATAAAFLPEPLRTIEMHLALGELSRARPSIAPSEPAWAQPLGIAASPRWIWHEFGHVLIASRLGDLEFDFAHSAGDAMAAVISDPYSRLADSGGGVAGDFRGMTYPWVFIPRRHDRCVMLGWSWSGTLNRSLLDAPAFQRDGRKGYIGEQILSSTLFRLYRSLGGDTVRADDKPNFALRERASLVTMYLLIQAVRSMAQPPSVAEALETCMEDADTGLTTPLALGGGDGWTGGRARKVVRWAFEAQGMFPPDRRVDHNAPGLAPAVDVYIPDGRPPEEMTGSGPVRHRPGGYVPVSLDWDGERKWQAIGKDLTLFPFRITLGNRGDQPATGLRMRAWFGLASGDPAARDWDMGDRIAWLPAIGPIDLGITIPGHGTVRAAAALEEAAAPAAAAGAAVLLLVEITCADDRANSDPAALLPTAIVDRPPEVPRHVADLVANDNNLGLWTLS